MKTDTTSSSGTSSLTSLDLSPGEFCCIIIPASTKDVTICLKMDSQIQNRCSFISGGKCFITVQDILHIRHFLVLLNVAMASFSFHQLYRLGCFQQGQFFSIFLIVMPIPTWMQMEVMQYIYLMASSPFHLSQWICEKSIPGKAHYRPHPFLFSKYSFSAISTARRHIVNVSTSITTHTSNFSRGKPNCVRCNHNFSSVILSDHF